MEHTIPAWLTNDFLTECLRSETGNENIEVLSFTASPAVPPGNNYGSVVTRVLLVYQTHSPDDNQEQRLSIIIKSEVTDGVIKEWMEHMQMVEPKFYKKFLPAVKKLTDTTFAPKSLNSPEKYFNITVLEDLKEEGFVMADRLELLDFDHCVLYMKAAASFHASSLAVQKVDPEVIKSIILNQANIEISSIQEDFKRLMVGGIRCFVKKIVSGGCNLARFTKYCKGLQDLSENMWPMVMESQKPCEGLNTLVQGDPWITNMMFKYDGEGNVKQIKLLDFQAPRWSSPMTDIVFFLWTSAKWEVRQTRLEELYHIYVDALNSKLEELNCEERLDHNTAMDKVRKLFHSPISMTTVFYPLLFNPEPINWTTLVQNKNEDEIEKCFEEFFNEEFCKAKLPIILETLEITGILDCIE